MTENLRDPVCGKLLKPDAEVFQMECNGVALGFCSAACGEKYSCDPAKKLVDYQFDLIIVGGGPAGLSAGIYAALTGLSTLILTKSLGGQAWDSTEVVNYPGFEFITGPDLVERFRQQLFDNLHLAHQFCTVSGIQKDGQTFHVTTDDGAEYRAHTLLLTTGMRRRWLGIPGEDTLRGKGVGEFHALNAGRFAGKETVVVGGGNSACQAALGLADAGARVTLACRSYRADNYLQDKLACNDNISVFRHRDPLRIEGTQRVEVLVVRNQDTGAEEVIPAEAIFVEVGLVPSSDLLRDMALINGRGEVEVDGNCRTGMPGLYAAGDVTSAFGKRILIAAGEGAKAVLAVAEYLRSRGVAAA